MKMILAIEQSPKAAHDLLDVAILRPPTKSWRERCRLLIANQYMGKPVLEGALRADVCFYIKPPQYILKPKKNQAALLAETIPVGKKPDIDNYEKALYDSMSGIVFRDDGQIALHTVGKFYSLNPRIEVLVERIEHVDC